MEETTLPTQKKRQITTVHIKEETKKFLEQNAMTPAYMIDNAPEWRQRMIEQGETITKQNQRVIELEAQNYRLMRENLDLHRFKNKILEEKYGIKDK